MVLRLKVFLFVVSALSLFDSRTDASSPRAENGVFDLRHLSTPDKFDVNLNGFWEFYWNKILSPGDFISANIKPDFYGQVPSYWTDYPEDSVKTNKYGYATYRLKVLLPAGLKTPLAFDMPVFDSSYEIYINGKLMGGNGIVGKTANESRPAYSRNFFRIIPDSATLDIVICVSNFDHRRGGFWLPVKMGTFPEVQKQLANSWAAEWSVITILLGFSIFFFFFFILSPKDMMMLFMSIATAGLAIRPLFTSHYLIHNLVKIDWIWIVRMEYIGLYIIYLGWSWFTVYLYPSVLIRIASWITTFLFAIAFVGTLFLPVKIFSYITLAYYPATLFLIMYLIARSLQESIKGSYPDMMNFAVFCLLLFAGLHDIRVASGKADSSMGYILTYTIVLFVMIQAALLLYKWIKAFNETEKLRYDLEYMNRNLEILVNERTQEIKTRNNEIEQQNIRIASQNKQLSDTINLKNRIFSLIAHDLRSPVVNILYMLNLLKEKEYQEKYDTFANSSIQYAQMVISLLENMLVWGRGQEDKIKFSPDQQDLADIILTNLSIFKETADNKDISVNFTQVGSSVAYIDRDLLDIIIRNLLSNAVKYTPRGGRISILLKDKTIEDEGILLKVCDNGVGIPEEKKKHLFTSADIESSPGTEQEKGTGLGLKLCRDLVKIHNGTISVDSTEGEGTCFSITLPAASPTTVSQIISPG